MKYKLMCIDVDGTLVNSNKDLPRENIKAIQEAWKVGLKIAIASGRAAESVQEILDDLGIEGYGVCLNGSYIVDGNNEISRQAFNDTHIEIIRKIVQKYDVRAFFATTSFNVTNKKPDDGWFKGIEKSVIKQKKLLFVIMMN